MEDNKELNEQELTQRIDTVRKCFKTIKELGKIGSITDRAFVHFFHCKRCGRTSRATCRDGEDIERRKKSGESM